MDEFDFEEFGILDHGEPQNVREPRTFPTATNFFAVNFSKIWSGLIKLYIQNNSRKRRPNVKLVGMVLFK